MYAACGGLRDKDHSLDGPKKSVCLILYDRDLLQSHSRGRTQGHFLRLHCVAYPSRTGYTIFVRYRDDNDMVGTIVESIFNLVARKVFPSVSSEAGYR